MNKKGFVLFTTLLYMTLVTAIFLSNLGMYENQMKINHEIGLAYESKTMALLATGKIRLTMDKEGIVEKQTIIEESSASNVPKIINNNQWIISFAQGIVNVIWDGVQFECQVLHFENDKTYTYEFEG